MKRMILKWVSSFIVTVPVYIMFNLYYKAFTNIGFLFVCFFIFFMLLDLFSFVRSKLKKSCKNCLYNQDCYHTDAFFEHDMVCGEWEDE